MSTTSADRYKYTSQSFLNHNKNRQEIRESPQKWSNEKVKDELSSFIAEFFYLTDIPNQKLENSNTPLKTYQLYPANTHKGNDEGFNKVANPDLYTNNHQMSNSRRRSRQKERRRTSSDDINQRHVSFPNKSGSTSKMVRNSNSRNHKIPNDGRLEHYPRKSSHQKNKSQNKFRSRSRSRSKEWKLKKTKKHNPRRSQSDHSALNITSHKHRRRSQTRKSLIKDMPYYYERTRARPPKRVKVVKRPSIRVSTKEVVMSENPSVITLYPKNAPNVEEIKGSINHPSFLQDPVLPCKCFQCKRKYESLKRLPEEPQNVEIFIPGYKEDHYDNTACSPRIMRGCYQDWPSNKAEVCCVNPCIDKFYKEEYCNPIEKSWLKGVEVVKFNTFSHHIDYNIKQYFHSILNRTTYC